MTTPTIYCCEEQGAIGDAVASDVLNPKWAPEVPDLTESDDPESVRVAVPTPTGLVPVEVGSKWRHDGCVWLVSSTRPGATSDGSEIVRLIEINDGKEDSVSAAWLLKHSERVS